MNDIENKHKTLLSFAKMSSLSDKKALNILIKKLEDNGIDVAKVSNQASDLPISAKEINLLKSISHFGDNQKSIKIEATENIHLRTLVEMKMSVDQWGSVITDWFFNPKNREELCNLPPFSYNEYLNNLTLYGANVHFTHEIEEGYAMALNLEGPSLLEDYKQLDRSVCFAKIKN